MDNRRPAGLAHRINNDMAIYEGARMNNDDRILTLQETAKMLGVSPVTLWRMHAKDGMIEKPLRISKGRKGYRLSTIKEHLAGGAA